MYQVMGVFRGSVFRVQEGMILNTQNAY